jgi:FkbM family methyltransferase
LETIKLPPALVAIRKFDFPRKLGLLEMMYGSGLAVHGVCWVECASGVTWKLDLADPTHRWIVYGDYEGSVQMNWLRSWLAGGGIVLDSGSNIGQMCQYIAPIPGVRVLCFEPLPEAHDWIRECLAQYPSWNVSLYQFGLSDSSSSITVQAKGSRTTARLDWYKGQDLARLEIRVEPLDDFARKQAIDRIRLWKLDVEGHEIAALKGARELLLAKRIEALLIEVSCHQVIPFLQEVGYELFRIGSRGALQPVLDPSTFGNLVALPAR